MLLSLRKNGLTSLFKEARVFKGCVGGPQLMPHMISRFQTQFCRGLARKNFRFEQFVVPPETPVSHGDEYLIISATIRAPQEGPERWCRTKIVEKWRKTFWRVLTSFDVFWRGSFPPAPFAIRWHKTWSDNFGVMLREVLVGHSLDIFETPVTVTPQQEILKTLNSSKIP